MFETRCAPQQVDDPAQELFIIEKGSVRVRGEARRRLRRRRRAVMRGMSAIQEGMSAIHPVGHRQTEVSITVHCNDWC